MPSPLEEVGPGEEPQARFGAAKPIDYAAVARISTQAELRGIRLAFTHADIDESKPISSDWVADTVIQLGTQDHFARDTGLLSVRCAFVAVYAPDVPVGERPSPADAPVEIHAHFVLDYAIEDVSGIRDGDSEHFALANGMLHAWPYWRELAHSTSVRMGLAPLVVGTLKMPWSGDPGREAIDRGPAGEG